MLNAISLIALICVFYCQYTYCESYASCTNNDVKREKNLKSGRAADGC